MSNTAFREAVAEEMADFNGSEPIMNSKSEEVWQEPKPLEVMLSPVLPVKDSMIPQSLRPWLKDIAYRMRCPTDYVVSPVVIMISSLIGTRLTIKPKAKDSWTVVPNLWGAAIGDPSAMKTPSASEVFKPLGRLISESRETYERQLLIHEEKDLLYDAQKKAYKEQETKRLIGKRVASDVSFPEPAPKPTERRYMSNDATVEKIGELMNENPPGLLIYRDELTGLLTSFERAGHEQDRAFYLEAWNGGGSMTIDRISRGTIHVKKLCLSMYGGIQPAKLLAYLRDATSCGNDGFVQRIQLAVYPDKPNWEYIDEYPDKEGRDQAYEVIRKIAESDLALISCEIDEYNTAPYTHFEADAQLVFKNWQIEWESQVIPNESGLLLEHFTKYRSLMPSLALIFQVVDWAANPTDFKPGEKLLISIESALKAVEWCEYLKSHAWRIYGLLANSHMEVAKELLRHLKKGDLKDGFKARDILRKQWSYLTKLEDIELALDELVDHGYIKRVQPKPAVVGRQEKPHFLIHPKFFPKL